MKTKALAIAAAVGVIVLVGAFAWATLRIRTSEGTLTSGNQPTASVSEALSDGLLNMQVYALDDLVVRLVIQFTSGANAIDTAGMPLDLNVAMVDMNNDGLDPPLEVLGPGKWSARLKLPMAGRWVASAGFGDDRAEVEFDAR